MKKILLITFLMFFVFSINILATAPAYESFNEGKAAGTSVTVTKPSGVASGDILIGCLSSDGGSETHTSPESDSWTDIYVGQSEGSGKQTFSMWWKEAGGSEPSDYTFGCGSSEGLYAWIIRVSGASTDSPIHKKGTNSADNASASPPCVITEVNDCLVISSFGADHCDITVDGTFYEMTTITIDKSSDAAGSASGGSGRDIQTSAGTSQPTWHNLTAEEEWVGVTVAIQLEQFVSLGASRFANASRVDQSGNDDVDVGGWQYTDKNKDVGNESVGTENVAFSSDGTKMYIMSSFGTDTVYQYTLSTGWDVSTATYAEKSKLVTDEAGSPMGLDFSSDGTKMYVLNNVDDVIYQYTLSTGWDVSTATYAEKSVDVTDKDSNAYGFTLSSDGTKMYAVGTANDTVWQYTLSTDWDISTATYADKSKNVSTESTQPLDVVFNSDGTKMYIMGTGVGISVVYQYTLSTGWDVSTATYANRSKDTAIEDGSGEGIFFSSDDAKMYISGEDNDTVYQYEMSTGWTKTNDFILATRIYTSEGPIARAYKLRWRDVTDAGSFVDISNTGEITYSATTDLTDGGTLEIGEKLCDAQGVYSWQNGLESEGDNLSPDSGTYSLADEYYTEFQWALDCNNANDEHEYEFELYDATKGISIGTCGPTITMAAAGVGWSHKWNTKTISKFNTKEFTKWDGLE